MTDHVSVAGVSGSADVPGVSGIFGRTAEDIAASIRALVDTGALAVGDSLPSVRALAETLGVNRNTTLTAYRLLVQAGIAETRRRAGTVIVDPLHGLAEEGFAQNSVLRDIGDGNPAPEFLPDPSGVQLASAPPVLYGESTIDPGFAEWGTRWIAVDQDRPFRLTVTAGAVDAVERLLAQAVVQGDPVALEDPCYLTSISTIRQNGYRAVPVPVDAEGMRPEGLRAALELGARAVVCTPRAHNPTGASVSAERALELRSVLAEFPQVFVIEDDHFALVSSSPYETIVPEGHRRWALVRSLSKALGPDMRVALVASDAETAERLSARISGGITWVSHLLQRITHAMLGNPDTRALVDDARAHYARRNRAFVSALESVGLGSESRDGLSVWVETHAPSAEVVTELMRRGWLARDGAAFALDSGDRARSSRCLRLTVHDLSDAEMAKLAADIVAAAGAPPDGGAARPTPQRAAV